MYRVDWEQLQVGKTCFCQIRSKLIWNLTDQWYVPYSKHIQYANGVNLDVIWENKAPVEWAVNNTLFIGQALCPPPPRLEIEWWLPYWPVLPVDTYCNTEKKHSDNPDTS